MQLPETESLTKLVYVFHRSKSDLFSFFCVFARFLNSLVTTAQ